MGHLKEDKYTDSKNMVGDCGAKRYVEAVWPWVGQWLVPELHLFPAVCQLLFQPLILMQEGEMGEAAVVSTEH